MSGANSQNDWNTQARLHIHVLENLMGFLFKRNFKWKNDQGSDKSNHFKVYQRRSRVEELPFERPP
jgi:hypothetical protein